MRSSRPHILDQRESFIKSNLYSPKLPLEPSLAEDVLRISSYASLGFHTAAMVRLANGEICAFTEWYPAAGLPCNGKNASSLFEVGQSGGPAFPAHEINLEIVGAKTMEQVRTVRRIRAMVPELQKFEVTETNVFIHHADLDNPIRFNDQQAIIGSCVKSFGKQRQVVFMEGERPLHETISFTELDRLAIRKIGNVAWTESKKHPAGGVKLAPQDDPLYRHVQTVLFDIPNSTATLIEQGPSKGAKVSQHMLHIEDRWPVTLFSTRCGGKAWSDAARSSVMQCPVTPEGVRVSPRGHELFITALLPESHAGSAMRTRGANEFPFETRFWEIGNEDRLSRTFFERLPATWSFRGLRRSPCETMVLLDADAPGEQALPVEIQHEIEKLTLRGIYYSHNRFQSVPFHDLHISQVLSRVPFGSVVLSVEQCVATGQIQLNTAYPISEDRIHAIERELGCSLKVKASRALAPVAVERPTKIISSNPSSPADMKPITDDKIRTLKVLGGAKDIGGSALLLGNVLLDCGAYPRNPTSRPTSVPEIREAVQHAELAIITHAHLDHVGRSLQLKRDIPVLMHHATALVSWPLLREQLTPEEGTSLYDLEQFYGKVCPIPFGYKVPLSNTLSATLIEAGHIAGSGMVLIEHQGPKGPWRAMYTGDLQQDNSGGHNRIHPPAANVGDVDALIIEATNGMAPVAHRAELEQQLIERIRESLKTGGRVLLPALASRAPELLTVLAKYRDFLPAPIYIDGPALGISNDIHSYLSHLLPGLFIQRNRLDQGWNGVANGYFKDIKRTGEEQFFRDRGPRIVVMSGGMGQGTAERHIKAARPEDTIIFTCYQAPGTLGHAILQKYQRVAEQGPWNGPTVLSQRLSGHISGEQLLGFVKNTLKPKGTVVLIHGGDQEKIAVKAALVQQDHAGEVIIARTGQEIEL
jgi:metallo-beta-lactamase family protein